MPASSQVHESPFFVTPHPTPMAGVFLGTCVTALHRGVALGDLIDAIIDAPLCGPFITWDEINHWVEIVSGIEPRDESTPEGWVDYCADNRLDPVSGAAIVLSSVIDEVVAQ